MVTLSPELKRHYEEEIKQRKAVVWNSALQELKRRKPDFFERVVWWTTTMVPHGWLAEDDD